MPGRPVELILARRIANPVIIVDEVCKAGHATSTTGSRHGFADALLSLIEPATAAAWECPFFRLPFDLSHVLWVMTANDGRSVPAPLRSRCPVINLPDISSAQMATFAETEGRRMGLSDAAVEAILDALDRANYGRHDSKANGKERCPPLAGGRACVGRSVLQVTVSGRSGTGDSHRSGADDHGRGTDHRKGASGQRPQCSSQEARPSGADTREDGTVGGMRDGSKSEGLCCGGRCRHRGSGHGGTAPDPFADTGLRGTGGKTGSKAGGRQQRFHVQSSGDRRCSQDEHGKKSTIGRK